MCVRKRPLDKLITLTRASQAKQKQRLIIFQTNIFTSAKRTSKSEMKQNQDKANTRNEKKEMQFSFLITNIKLKIIYDMKKYKINIYLCF